MARRQRREKGKKKGYNHSQQDGRRKRWTASRFLASRKATRKWNCCAGLKKKEAVVLMRRGTRKRKGFLAIKS